jgi:hypothetical protein
MRAAPIPNLRGAALLLALACLGSELQAQEDHFALNTWIGGSATHSGNLGFALAFAPSGVARSGVRWQAVVVQGYYRYPSGASPGTTVRGRYTDISPMLGYEVVGGRAGFLASIGPSVFVKELTPEEPGERTGTRLGTKIAALGYVAPANAPSAFAFGSYSSADETTNLYANVGFDVGGKVSIGPEIGLIDTRNYRQTRAGAHFSGFRIGRVIAGVSIGRTRDNHGNRGGNLGMNARITF